jgi:hypothetical protein
MTIWNRTIAPAQLRFRRKRARLIANAFPELQGGVVIDIGGALPFWQAVGDILKPAKIIIYNTVDTRMRMGQREADKRIEMQLYDGQTVPQSDDFADVVICNSVIEHVPLENRARLASEIQRVGRRYVVQTPAPEFPLELHYGLPFVHWLPRPLARKIVLASPFALLTTINIRKYFDETQLLPRGEFERYFPEARIEIERFAGIPKSMLAFG